VEGSLAGADCPIGRPLRCISGSERLECHVNGNVHVHASVKCGMCWECVMWGCVGRDEAEGVASVTGSRSKRGLVRRSGAARAMAGKTVPAALMMVIAGTSPAMPGHRSPATGQHRALAP
jgi:hypothetical protein